MISTRIETKWVLFLVKSILVPRVYQKWIQMWVNIVLSFEVIAERKNAMFCSVEWSIQDINWCRNIGTDDCWKLSSWSSLVQLGFLVLKSRKVNGSKQRLMDNDHHFSELISLFLAKWITVHHEYKLYPPQDKFPCALDNHQIPILLVNPSLITELPISSWFPAGIKTSQFFWA